jgi:hypothetical protein
MLLLVGSPSQANSGGVSYPMSSLEFFSASSAKWTTACAIRSGTSRDLRSFVASAICSQSHASRRYWSSWSTPNAHQTYKRFYSSQGWGMLRGPFGENRAGTVAFLPQCCRGPTGRLGRMSRGPLSFSLEVVGKATRADLATLLWVIPLVWDLSHARRSGRQALRRRTQL